MVNFFDVFGSDDKYQIHSCNHVYRIVMLKKSSLQKKAFSRLLRHQIMTWHKYLKYTRL